MIGPKADLSLRLEAYFEPLTDLTYDLIWLASLRLLSNPEAKVPKEILYI